MGKQDKDIRKQIRNVFQAEASALLSTELLEGLRTKLADEQAKRLDAIETYCRDALTKSDSRSRAIEAFLMKVVKTEIQNDLYNANITLEAITAVFADAGLNIENFAAKVDAKKVEIDAAKKKAADEAMRAEMEARANKPAPGALVDAPAKAEDMQPKEEIKPAEAAPAPSA